MRGIRILRSKLSSTSVLTRTHLSSWHVKVIHISSPTTETTFTRPLNSMFSIAISTFCTSNIHNPVVSSIRDGQEGMCSHSDNDDSDDDYDSDDVVGARVAQDNFRDDALVHDVKTVMNILCDSGKNRVEMKHKIEQCGVKVSRELVLEVISRVRNDWEATFTFFLWAARQPGYAHSVREYHAMISILCKMRKFDTAWTLIDEMRGVKTGIPLVNPQTLLIMIRRYSAVHDVGRAINTFYAYKRFRFEVGIEEFQSLLSALCRYKNVQDAEHLMFCNRDAFSFNTKSFNIVLNGWCNVFGSSRVAERVWREMSKRRIRYDVISYASMMSCYSKTKNLYKVLKLYDRMKKVGIEPDRKVYNAVIHALAKGRHVKEAINLMKTMEEKGVRPTIVTYNSLIKPLCRSQQVDEAKGVFDEMLQRGISPTIRTYHAFLRILRTGEEVFALLEKMRRKGCPPTNDTFIMLIRKFCRWRQLDNVFKLWNEMNENGISPDRSAYIVLIHGLFLNGELETAYKYYTDMKEKQLLPEPKIEERLQTWFSNKQIAGSQLIESESHEFKSHKKTQAIFKKTDHEKHFLQQAETRKVVRARGFSFWE